MAKLCPSAPIKEFDDDNNETTQETDHLFMNRNGLLNTIKVPQNLSNLTKRLPKSNYSLK